MPRRPDPQNVLSFTRTTAATVGLAPGQQERTVWDRDTPGFGLRIRAGGSRAWVIRPAPASGRYGLIALGPTTQLNLAQARDAARNQLARARLGDGPREARRKAPVVTIGTVFETYLDRAEGRLKPANLKDLERYLKRDFKALHRLSVSGVSRADVAVCLDELTARAPATANRARSQLSTFFVWAIGQSLCEVNPVVGTNKPAREVRRSRVLAGPELTRLWHELRDDDFDRICRLLLLTGQRRDEVAHIVWDELDLDRRIWTLPEARTKNGRVHEVPLSEPALGSRLDQHQKATTAASARAEA